MQKSISLREHSNESHKSDECELANQSACSTTPMRGSRRLSTNLAMWQQRGMQITEHRYMEYIQAKSEEIQTALASHHDQSLIDEERRV